MAKSIDGNEYKIDKIQPSHAFKFLLSILPTEP